MFTTTLKKSTYLPKLLHKVCDDVSRAVLEGFAADAYRSGKLSRAEIGELLEHQSLWDTQSVLAEHEAWPAPTLDEVAQDVASLRRIPMP